MWQRNYKIPSKIEGEKKLSCYILFITETSFAKEETFSIYLDQLNERSIYSLHSDRDTVNSLELAGSNTRGPTEERETKKEKDIVDPRTGKKSNTRSARGQRERERGQERQRER